MYDESNIEIRFVSRVLARQFRTPQRKRRQMLMLHVSPSSRSLMYVAAAATLLGTEGLLRRPLLDDMSVTSIVLAEHLLLVLFAIPVLYRQRRTLARLSLRSWCLLLVIGWGASGLAALMFTKALETGNPTTASLLQNTQPLFVVLLAVLILRERLARLYWPCLAGSLIGAYLLSFGTTSPVWHLNSDEISAAGLALGAAALWASGTVLARLVLTELSYVTLTAARFMLALPFLFVVAAPGGDATGAVRGIVSSPGTLILAALVPGLIAMLLFYRGLSGTNASYAVLAEFMYPTAAIIGNWIVLGTRISPLQLIGCLLLLAIVTVLAWNPVTFSARPTPATIPAAAQ